VCGGGGTPNQCALNTKFCSKDGWCWEHPLPQGNDLNAVWAASNGNLWAVGAAGTVIGWNGSVWFLAPPLVTDDLTAVYGTSASDVWAVGASGKILHFDGTSWTVMDSGTTVNLYGVFATTDGGAWVVGAATNPVMPPTLRHWDGVQWLGVSNPLSGGSALRAIWGRSADDIHAVGDESRELHFDGTTWTPDQTLGQNYTAIHGAPTGEVFASCEFGVLASGPDGGGWVYVTGGMFAANGGVHVLPTGTVVASLADGEIDRFDPPDFAPRIPELTPGGRLTDAWTGFADDPSGQVWAVGSAGWIASRALDAGWRFFPSTASNTDVSSDLEAAWAPNNVDAYAGGTQTFYFRNNDGTWDYSTYNGTHNFDDLRAITGWSASNYAIVGTSSGAPGTVGEFIGMNLNWSDVTPAPLYAAWADPTGPLYVAGDDGVWVEQVRDAGWLSLGNGLDGGLRALTGCNGAIWLGAQGGYGYLSNTTWVSFSTAGTTWTGIWCDPFSVPWFAGSGGQVSSNGGNIASPTTEDLFAISGSDIDREFFVSGDHGTILRYRRDAGLQAEASGTHRALRGLWVTDGGVTAVGDRATVLRRAR
jgi:hypothetical protein